MKYSDLLPILFSLSPEQLDCEVIISVGNDEDEIVPVEDVRFLRSDNESFDLKQGHPLFRVT